VTGDEKKVIHLARDIIDGLGIETRLYGSEERPILIATVNPKAKHLIAFNGHLDVVPPASLDAWSHDPFDPQVVGDNLTGRGSADMKAACAVMIHVASIITELDLPLGVALHLVPDEEKGATHGTKALLEEVKKGAVRRPDYVVIGEKSNLKLRVAERGSWGFKIKFKGRATHTAYARYEGINAIAKASKGVLALEKPIDKWHPWIGAPVISVNAIVAGTAGNQVPDECTISIDRRLIPGETPETVAAEVKKALDEAGKGDPDWRWEIDAPRGKDGKWTYTPANLTDPDTELGKALKSAVKKATGHEPELFVEWAGGTDGAYYREAGIQTIGFGPTGEHMHGPNELVYIDTLIQQARVYVALTYELAK
jgi:acetylornithine deacetylase/succinyl-diaminopimelate desuccinylase family protein